MGKSRVMQLVAYRNTMAGAKRIIREAPEKRQSSRDRLIQLSLDYQARLRERERRETERQERIRNAVAKQKADWRRRLAAMRNAAAPPTHHGDIIEMAAAWHGVAVEDVMSVSRNRKVVAARTDAIGAVWLNCEVEGARPTLPSVGRIFKRDHTTILHALRKLGISSFQHEGRGR
jgi:chromosomal replication initiation ATPase DnaA